MEGGPPEVEQMCNHAGGGFSRGRTTKICLDLQIMEGGLPEVEQMCNHAGAGFPEVEQRKWFRFENHGGGLPEVEQICNDAGGF